MTGFSCFDGIPACDRQIDGQTDMYRAIQTCRAVTKQSAKERPRPTDRATDNRAGHGALWVPVHKSSGVATGWTGVDIPDPLSLEVAPEIVVRIRRVFTAGRGRGVGLRLQTPVTGSRSPCLSTPRILTWRRPCTGDRPRTTRCGYN